MENFHKEVASIVNFHKTLLGWRISTTTGFVGKFPQKVALLEHNHKILFSCQLSKKTLVVSPIIGFVGKFPQKLALLQISTIICFFRKLTQ